MRYQQTFIAALLLSIIFFVPAGFPVWKTTYGTISPDNYEVKQIKGGRQDYTLKFIDEGALVVNQANLPDTSLTSATGSLLYLSFLGHYSNFSELTPSPHTYIITLLGVFAGGIGYLNHQQAQGSGEPLTMEQLNTITLTGLSFNIDMHVEIELVDNRGGLSVKICSRIKSTYNNGAPKTILVTVAFGSGDTDMTLEFVVSVPGSQRLVDIPLMGKSDDSINGDEEEDPDAGCCGSCLSAIAGYVISFCCGSRSSETQCITPTSSGGYNTFRLTPLVEIDSPVKMSVGAGALLSAPAISVY